MENTLIPNRFDFEVTKNDQDCGKVGIGRIAFFLVWSCLFCIDFWLTHHDATSLGLTAEIEIFPDRYISIDAIMVSYLTYAGGVVICIGRLMNIGISSWWCLLGIVPVLSGFLTYCCLALPQNYTTTKTLDRFAAGITCLLAAGVLANAIYGWIDPIELIIAL